VEEKMKQKKYLMFLIPLVAVVVIVESIVLVSGLNKKQVESGLPVTQVTKTPPVLDIVFGGKTKMKLGESSEVELSLVSKNDYAVDSIDLFVKYDKTAFNLNDLTAGNLLPQPSFSKISEKTSLVVVSYKVAEAEGFQIKKNVPLSLAKFKVTPKREGSFTFEVNTGEADKESVTMFVKTGRPITVLPFSSNKLTVQVER
jgi:hypothetical protein